MNTIQPNVTGRRVAVGKPNRAENKESDESDDEEGDERRPSRARRRAAASDERRARPRGARRYLQTHQVCERYGGVSPRTVRRWVGSGRLAPPMKVNGRDYHSEDDLDAADEAARVAGTPAER
jgi:hypothetical protein